MKSFRRKVSIKNRLGLHMRPAAEISRIAHSYDAEVTLINSNNCADAHSIFDLLILGVVYGDRLEILARGYDAEIVLTEIIDFLNAYSDCEQHDLEEEFRSDSYAA